MEIDFVNEKFPELNLPEGQFQTISGYVVMTSETIPELGQEVILGDYKFIIEKVDDTKIEVLRVVKVDHDEEFGIDL